MDGRGSDWEAAWAAAKEADQRPDDTVYYDGRVTDADFADPPPRWADEDADPAPETHTDGRPLYAGRPGRDPYQRGGGYRQTSQEIWDAIRDAYLAGESGASVAARFGMARSTFFAHAREQGWLRQDQPAPAPAPAWVDEPVDLEAETAAGLPDYGVLAAHALVRMERAILNGRAMEAGRWLRLHTQLSALAERKAEAETANAGAREGIAPSPAPSLKKKPPTPQAPDPQTAALSRMRTVQTLARAAASLNPEDSVGRILLNKSLAILDALDPPPVDAQSSVPPSVEPAKSARSPKSDCSDCSDSVFPSDPPP
ncbi:hypothetical protein [Brevundimonas sp. SORGH_AS_0993]|uniref:hypothetical protein n=1 Tax=Brevundimonas sp. SORGH_AS_0993 TaxID=3041794 RepID=UPI0027842167|nr:hypothetical protein [Brevundimonas sp. SORGH_AS_0993]MDQ1155222.1 hypothetical protein [Brevundimonas sp. SORGH_AS_0993]